jgi:hypothetical protein
MANYYTRTVITETFLLTEELVSVLSARGAAVYSEGEKETVLDAIVAERPPLSRFSIVFEDGWVEPCDDVDEFLIEYAGWSSDKVEEHYSESFRELVVAGEAAILLEILKLNPDREHIEMQASWSCSKMRLDGFGGSGVIVNRKGYLYLTTTQYEIDEDGVIEPSGKFVFWDDEESAAA